MINLRPHQSAARDRVLAEYRAGRRSTLVAACVGSGKTYLAAALFQVAKRPGLFFVHTRALVEQTAKEFETFGLETGIEMADQKRGAALPKVTVASVQSISKRLDDYPADGFGLVVSDECHRVLGKSHMRIVNHFQSARILGLSGTPTRTDGRPLGQVFESVAFEYPIATAIADSNTERLAGRPGWLCPIRMRTILVEDLTLANVRMKGRHDYDPDDLAKQLCVESALHAVADPLLRLAGERPTIAFACNVAHARGLEEVMNRYRPGCALAVAGEDKDADERIRCYRRGEVQFLINVALLVEGFDAPETACIAIARPTQSQSLLIQALGRGLRVSPGKVDCLALDFTGADDAPDLCSPADALGGSLDPAVTRVLRKKAVDGDLVDLAAEIAAASQFVAEAVRNDLITAARFIELDLEKLSPFQILKVVTPEGRFAGAPVGPGLKAAMIEAGFRVKDTVGIDRGQGEALLEAAHDRKRRGLCTLKAARWLLKYGLNGDVDKRLGAEAMQLFASMEWRACPPRLRNDPRFQVQSEGRKAA